MLEEDLMFQSADEHIAMMEAAISIKDKEKNKSKSPQKRVFNRYVLYLALATTLIIVFLIILLFFI